MYNIYMYSISIYICNGVVYKLRNNSGIVNSIYVASSGTANKDINIEHAVS